MEKLLKINDLCVLIDGKEIIKNLSLSINAGQIHAIMGPNGSGKSSLAYTIMGHPNYVVERGEIKIFDKNINSLSADKRAKLGIFLAFQDPCEIPGATVFSVLKELYVAKSQKLVTLVNFSAILFKKMDLLGINYEFAYRDLNSGFSGGEKKKFEILQMLVLQPKLVILDEIDSGLDIDALKVVAKGILEAKKENPDMGILIITHYNRILKYITPDFVHLMQNCEIKKSGDFSLVKDIELYGYSQYGFVDGDKKNA